MDLFGLFGKKKQKDIPKSSNLFMQHQMESRIDSVDSDQIPKGYGPFGLCATNPVPIASISGANAYLASLRTEDGRLVAAHRIGSASAPDVTNGMIDVYRLTSNDESVGTVYLCPYHKRNSAKTPDGFRMAESGSREDDERFVEVFFSDPNDCIRFFTSLKCTVVLSADTACEARLEKIDPERWLYTVSRDGQFLADYVKPFKPSAENIESFNRGVKEMAHRLDVYLQTGDFSRLPQSPPFGSLTTLGPPPIGTKHRT